MYKQTTNTKTDHIQLKLNRQRYAHRACGQYIGDTINHVISGTEIFYPMVLFNTTSYTPYSNPHLPRYTGTLSFAGRSPAGRSLEHKELDVYPFPDWGNGPLACSMIEPLLGPFALNPFSLQRGGSSSPAYGSSLELEIRVRQGVSITGSDESITHNPSLLLRFADVVVATAPTSPTTEEDDLRVTQQQKSEGRPFQLLPEPAFVRTQGQ